MGCFESKTTRTEPVAVRGCTDVCWLVIFILFWVVLIFIATFAFIYGNPTRIINGYDSFGNTCGVKSNEKFADLNSKASGISTIDKPYVFFFNLGKDIKKSLKLCVKECPKQQINSSSELLAYFHRNGTQYCRYDFDMEKLGSVKNSNDEAVFHVNGPCPQFPIHHSEPLFHRCIPTGDNGPLKEAQQLYSLVSSWDFVEQTARDLYKSWHIIALICGLALIFSIILIGLLHYLTQIISWLICIFVGVASIGITVLLWWTYYDIKKNKENAKIAELSQYLQNETAVYIFAIIATICMIILLVVIYLMSSKFAGLAALFEEAGKCMYSIPQIFGPPLLAFIALMIFFAFWISVVVCLATATIPGVKPFLDVTNPQENIPTNIDNPKNGAELQKTFKLVEYHETDYTKYALYIYLVALIWVSEFIFAASQLCLAGAVALWYFKKPTESPVCDSMGKLVKYHLGSVVKGSFLITLFKIPRLILSYLYAKFKTAAGKGNGLADCCLKCCICCFWCLEKFIRYLNHNAYTVIAIESINFCPAAGVAWKAIWTHVVSVATINGIGDFVLFLGKLAVAGICGFIALLLLKNNEEVQFYMIPVFVIAVFAFFVAHVILSLYEIVVDTLFLCVYEDRHINGPNGRWKDSNLANLLGEEKVIAVEGQMHEVELQPITKQPFGSYRNDQATIEPA
jgi:solute carrier family 44 protein 1 (choline transporter-like protein)